MLIKDGKSVQPWHMHIKIFYYIKKNFSIDLENFEDYKFPTFPLGKKFEIIKKGSEGAFRLKHHLASSMAATMVSSTSWAISSRSTLPTIPIIFVGRGIPI